MPCNKICKFEAVSAFGAIFIVALLCGCAQNNKIRKSMLFQYSTINALAEGLYSSEFFVDELLKHGDFGLGTFDGLDGEMYIESGKAFQIKASGEVVEAWPNAKTPFAIVIPFKSDSTQKINKNIPFDMLYPLIDGMRKSNNYIYGIRIKGSFNSIITRSLHKQKDGIRLVDVVKTQQVVFQKKESVKGTLVGFYFPPYMKDINVTGYHFHFMADDKSIAGHLLSIQLESGVIEVDEIKHFTMQLPKTEGFSQLGLMKTKDDELHIIEKQK